MRLFPVAVCCFLAVLPGCSSWQSPPAADDFGQLPSFAMTERSGRSITRDDLSGKVWTASFTFTRCGGACSQIQETMQKLQAAFASEPDFRLVSISVDPEHDTPEVQRLYADQKRADAERWLFLSGKQDETYRLITEGFHLTVFQVEGPQRKPGFEVEHTPKVALVDRRGHVRGYFDGRQRDDNGNPIDDLPALRRTVQALLREKL